MAHLENLVNLLKIEIHSNICLGSASTSDDSSQIVNNGLLEVLANDAHIDIARYIV